MQNKNTSSTSKPKAGDGTQMTTRKQDANWYGASQQPQEEFTSDHQGSGGQQGPISAAEPAKNEPRTSEGTPFNADSGRDLLTPERAEKRDTKKPSDRSH